MATSGGSLRQRHQPSGEEGGAVTSDSGWRSKPSNEEARACWSPAPPQQIIVDRSNHAGYRLAANIFILS